MKLYVILINWLVSLFSLCIDTETAPLWVVVAVVAWFGISTRWLVGVEKELIKRFELEEL